jgi:hypothetical protein
MQRARRTPEPEEPRPQALAAKREPAKSDPDDPALDWVDVPAAVVCAFCGKPDCAGCIDVAENTSASGVVAIIPWERPGLGWVTRMWSTARLATLSHREFFASISEGAFRPAFEFALVAELLASTGVALCFGGAIALVPGFLTTALSDAVVRHVLLRVLAFGVPGLATLMVVLHATHGLMVDRAARAGGSRKRGRGLRFGLYACGWDLVTLPLGLLVVLCTEGLGATKRAATSAFTVPAQATQAYLSSIHALSPTAARRAASRANVHTALASLALLALTAVLVVLGVT